MGRAQTLEKGAWISKKAFEKIMGNKGPDMLSVNCPLYSPSSPIGGLTKEGLRTNLELHLLAHFDKQAALERNPKLAAGLIPPDFKDLREQTKNS
jgi:hypothetical protein